ncbi:MAG: ABC transporter permease [Spirochaetaceae bacterium]|jgi:peptide/nickel transport system permease protein|nr:ABC transporter permease [Spirochaetaceae bacterium]
MGRYLGRRLLSVVPVLFLVSLAVFSLGALLPGDAAAALLGPDAAPEDILFQRRRMGLDLGPARRYFLWIRALLRGDLGLSMGNGLPVAELLAQRAGPTFSLALFSLALSLLIAVPLGFAAALKKGSSADLVCSLAALGGVSVPGFLLGLFLILVFAVALRWFPAAGYVPPAAGFLAHLRSVTLPGTALALMYAALLMRVIRSSLAETLGRDYVRFARSKGAGKLSAAFRHALPNSLAPILSVLGQGFIGALSGAAVVESVFGIPGIGALTASSIARRDLPVIQAVVLLCALLNQGLNLLIDLLSALADPRINLGPGGQE